MSEVVENMKKSKKKNIHKNNKTVKQFLQKLP